MESILAPSSRQLRLQLVNLVVPLRASILARADQLAPEYMARALGDLFAALDRWTVDETAALTAQRDTVSRA